MEYRIPLLPRSAKFIGLAFIILSLISGYLYFLGGKPQIFNVKVFAILSMYVKKRYFVIAQTNILDEMAAVLLILGLVAIFFSKKKKEKPIYNHFRIKALVNSLFITLGVWIALFLLIYGMAIFIVSTLIFYLFLILCLTLFSIYIYKDKRAGKMNKNQS